MGEWDEEREVEVAAGGVEEEGNSSRAGVEEDEDGIVSPPMIEQCVEKRRTVWLQGGTRLW